MIDVLKIGAGVLAIGALIGLVVYAVLHWLFGSVGA